MKHQRFPRIWFASFLLPLLLSLTQLSPPAAASTLPTFSLQQLTQFSDAVVLGTVVKVTSYRKDRFVVTDTVFHVEHFLKGSFPHTITIHQRGGRVKDFATIVPGMPTYHIGENLLLFLEAKRSGTFVTAGMWQGKLAVNEINQEKFVQVPPSFFLKYNTQQTKNSSSPPYSVRINPLDHSTLLLIPLATIKEHIERAVNKNL